MKALSIRNYKNLKTLWLENLKRVNLIVGTNNVGKSTLLEAIALHASNAHIATVYDILDMRGEVIRARNSQSVDIESFYSLFTDRNAAGFYNDGITFDTENADGEHSKVKVELQKFERVTRNNGEDGSYVMTVSVDPETPLSANISLSFVVSCNDNFFRRYELDGNYRKSQSEEKGNYEYVRTSQIASYRNAELFDKIALTDLEDEIVKALQIIDERISKINFLKDGASRDDSDRVPYVVLRNNGKCRLFSMGDGINRILTIVLSLLNCKGGVLLIDEFENGLHHSVQTQLWQIINELAERLDVQVFATTHSNDCIRSFAKADKNGNGLIIRLQQSPEGIEPVYFTDYKEVLFALDNDIDIR